MNRRMQACAAAIGAGIVTAATGASAAGGLSVVLGRALFERNWVEAPSSTDASDGLGPLFNARSCAACHPGGGGAVFSVEGGAPVSTGLVLRFGDAAGRPDPRLGLQLQTRAVSGLAAEGELTLAEVDGRLLAQATHRDGALRQSTPASVRQAPPLFGRGAFERVPDSVILAGADPADSDGDGISGRANILPGGRVGRYGWKARHADLSAQVAEAFAVDIGMSSPLRPAPYGDCTAFAAGCRAAPSGASEALGGHELSAEMLGLVRDYVASLEAPAPGDAAGLALFRRSGCDACHVPFLADAAGRPVRAFTDLLLHDVGPGLDDGAGEPGVGSGEWRTAPLAALAGRRYLHDARAPSLHAAIRAHASEAEGARARYEALSDAERSTLLEFLETL